MSKHKKHFLLAAILLVFSYSSTFLAIGIVALRPFGEHDTLLAAIVYGAGWIFHLTGIYFGGKAFISLLHKKKELLVKVKDKGKEVGNRAIKVGKSVGAKTIKETKNLKNKILG
ncbi:hypothetical protein ACFLZB_02615 [Nanoarchaeota archaeon]